MKSKLLFFFERRLYSSIPSIYQHCIAILLSCQIQFVATSQTIPWQHQIGHPQLNFNQINYWERGAGWANFDSTFVAGFDGATPLPVSYDDKYNFLQFYDYQGNLINEITVGGMSISSNVVKITDSTFLVRVNYRRLRTGIAPYDTGQMGGYLLREYTSRGRLLWQQRMYEGTVTRGNDIHPRPGGFCLLTYLNRNPQGFNDTLSMEYFQPGGLLERVVTFPSISASGFFAFRLNPERLLVTRAQRWANNQWLYTVAHLDSAFQIRREDTLGYLHKLTSNQTITLWPDGSYRVTMPTLGFPDSIRTRYYFVDANGQLARRIVKDSGGTTYLPLADGGALGFTQKLACATTTQYDSLINLGLPVNLEASFKRLDRNFLPVWSVSILDWFSDSVNLSYQPVASIPSSPEDAIFTGRRVVSSRVHSEPWGTFALVGRINGVGRLFDPTGLKQHTGPRSQVQPGLIAYPNPARSSFTIKNLQKPTAYQLYDMQGRQVQQGTAYPHTPIELMDVPKGVYVLRVGEQAIRVVRE